MDAFGLNVAVLVFAGLLVLILFLGVKTVPQGMNFTVERFRRYRSTLGPGLNIIVPLVDTIGARIRMMEQVLDIPRQEVITRDNATITVDGVAFFQVLDAARAAYEVLDLQKAILALIMTNVRTVMGSMDLDHALSQRDDINQRLLGIADAATAPWGVKITRVEIRDITPPRDLVEAMGRQMKAERDKRAEVLKAEGSRQSEILKAEGHKRAQILAAEGRREAAFRDAEARERLAEAEGNATTSIAAAVSGEGGIQAVNYFVADKYVKALEALAAAPNQKVLMMPLDTSSVIGSLAGIAEIAQETFAARPRTDGDARPH